MTNTQTQRVPLGRPNRTDDGQPVQLDQAINASPIRTAYTRREPDQQHSDARVIVAEQNANGEWWVSEYRLGPPQGAGGMTGWPMQDYRDAEVYIAYKLDVPRDAVWWPASAPLEIQWGHGAYAHVHSTVTNGTR